MPSALEEFESALSHEWQRISRPGTWWTGPERVAIATEARLASRGLGDSGALPGPVAEASRMVATEAATIRPELIAKWSEEGLDAFAYVEIIGVVSLLTAFDVAAFGLGRAEEPLEPGQPGSPSQVIPDGAEVSDGWVPTVGRAWAPESLSAVTAERDAMMDAHGPLYMTMEEMGDMEIVRNGLTRAEIELVAARTSMLNDCFY